MPDASTAQLLTIAIVSGVGSGLLTAGIPALTKLGEFRREDRARWVAEKREQYARLIDEATEMSTAALLGEIAASVLDNGQEYSDDADPVRQMVREHGQAVFEHHQATTGPVAVLRLLAPEDVIPAMETLELAAGKLMQHYLVFSRSGGLYDNAGAVAARQSLNAATQAFTDAARSDIRV